MADTDRYERIAATYADELRDVADRLDRMRAELALIPVSPRSYRLALLIVDTACGALRRKAGALDDLPALVDLWDDDQEGDGGR